MNEQIIAHCREHSEGVTSREIAELFLKFKGADPRLAHIAVNGLLSKDNRFELGHDGLWRVQVAAAAQGSPRLRDLPWAAVAVLAHKGRVMHVSIWSVFPQPQPVLNEWVVDPATVSPEEQETLRHLLDPDFNPSRQEALIGVIAENIANASAVFSIGQQHALLSRHCLGAGEILSDDFLTMGTLLNGAGIAPPRPMNIHLLGRILDITGPGAPSARESGRILAECVAELISRLEHKGIETEAQLAECETRLSREFDFTGKQFSFEELSGLPTTSGVYGFSDSTGKTIYIGKATNLRRRILSYFQKSEESPAKLETLRSQSHSLITHRCGSELESLIYEHRLIIKHAPALNSQVAINERKGDYKPVADCVILLPHADPDKGVSVWFKTGQKIQLRTFNADFTGTEPYARELGEFFFGAKLPVSNTDFPEQEIAQRWVKRHMDSLMMVAAGNLANGDEILDAMRSYWNEGRRQHAA